MQHIKLFEGFINEAQQHTPEAIEFCKKYGMSSAQFTGEQRIEGSLFLNGPEKLPPGFSPKVGGSLDLRGLEKLPIDWTWIEGIEGDVNITVSGKPTSLQGLAKKPIEWVRVQ